VVYHRYHRQVDDETARGESVEPKLSPGEALRARLAAYHRNWVEPLVGRTCTRVAVDNYSPPVVLWFHYDGPTARIELYAPFSLSIGPTRYELDPYADRAQLGPVLALIGRTVRAAMADRDDGLTVDFDGDARLEVERSGHSEPWWFDVDEDWPDG